MPADQACAVGRVKTQTIKTAIESAILLLRVDDVVSGVSKKKDGVGGNRSAGAPPTLPHPSPMCVPLTQVCAAGRAAPPPQEESGEAQFGGAMEN